MQSSLNLSAVDSIHQFLCLWCWMCALAFLLHFYFQLSPGSVTASALLPPHVIFFVAVDTAAAAHLLALCAKAFTSCLASLRASASVALGHLAGMMPQP